MHPRSIADTLQTAVRRLIGCSDSPRLDAELLLCKVLMVPRSGLVMCAADPLATKTLGTFERLLAQRVAGAPIAYLTGSREFWSLSLNVTSDVLVPRPETELLVEQALALVPEFTARSVLDLGTGSGAIALAIASERPQASLSAVDISAAALAVARTNSRRLGLTRIDWRLGSWFAAVGEMRFDVIVANPPDVAANDPALLHLAAEPALALTPGPTGLEALREIIDGAAAHLEPHGWLLLEHGSDQGDDVRRMLERQCFVDIRTCADYADKPRVTLGCLHVFLRSL